MSFAKMYFFKKVESLRSQNEDKKNFFFHLTFYPRLSDPIMFKGTESQKEKRTKMTSAVLKKI